VQRTSQLGPVGKERAAAGGPEARGGPWPRRTAARLLAAAAVALIGGGATLGVIAHGQAMRLRESQRDSQLISVVLSSPDRVMLTARISTGGTATVVMSHRRRALVFTAHGLRALPGSQGYELWLMGPSGDRPAGMLAVRAGGMAGPAVISGLAPADMIGLTVEPSGGSPQPTTPPIVTIGGAAP
jgi:anti-sigma-K factor RskA